ncbi:MAG: sulfite exporter TauE/SafE family protein [Cyclobacteriaceae bacterium]
MWVTALLIGFAGSFHCLGMCSPLAMAVTSMKPSALFNRFLYNTGRITTYALMGSIVSGAGFLLPFHKFQNIISIALGLALLVIGFGGLRKITIPGLTSLMQKLSSRLKALFGRQLKHKSMGAIVILGALNGLLPCGLTFIALTWCLTLKGPLDGFNFMLLFGAGTLPVMLGVTGILPVLINRFNWNLQRVTTAVLIFSGCILIARVFIIHLPHASSLNQGFADIVLCR